jgi:hypothetical protein
MLAALAAPAQKPQGRNLPPRDGTLATLIRIANLYVGPDASLNRLALVTPGRELVITERNGKWLRVFANVDAPESRKSDLPLMEQGAEVTPVSGWMLDKGVVDVHTEHGDQILFGAAQSAEDAAIEPDPPARAAQDARLLYRRIVEMFPQSQLTPEAMWRAADLRWQMQKADAASLPSAHEKEAYLREQMDEDELRKVEKYFPHSKWSELAAYALIDNKLCGDWQGSEKCPEKEAGFYLQYAEQHPDSPKAPEALYKAAWREAAAGDMWVEDGDPKRAAEDRKYAAGLVDRIEKQYPQSADATRAATLLYEVTQEIPVYGSARQ